MITIPSPKFSIGQKVITPNGVATVLTWMYVPIDPIPNSDSTPYYDAGFDYICKGSLFWEKPELQIIDHFHESALKHFED